MHTQVVAKNLVRLRQSHNWTQQDISDRLHISRQAISKWETGTSIPNLETLLELSKLYKITINEILEPPTKNKISNFEEIINVDPSKLKTILDLFSPLEIVKASMGASPVINEHLKKLYNDFDFYKERAKIGNIRVTEIEDLHTRIVDMINSQLIDM